MTGWSSVWGRGGSPERGAPAAGWTAFSPTSFVTVPISRRSWHDGSRCSGVTPLHHVHDVRHVQCRQRHVAASDHARHRCERCRCGIGSRMGTVLLQTRCAVPGNIAAAAEDQIASRRPGWWRPHIRPRARSGGLDPAVPGVNVMNHSVVGHVTVGDGIVPT